MDPFQREVIDRLARIETKVEAMGTLPDRVQALEKGESRRTALTTGVAAVVAAGITSVAGIIKG